MEPDYRYQNRQQNFNSAPAPVQQPVKVKKKKGCPIAVAIICLILAIGGVGFGIFEMLTVKNIEFQPKQDEEVENNKFKIEEDDREDNTQQEGQQYSHSSASKAIELISNYNYTVENADEDDLYTNKENITPIFENIYLVRSDNGWKLYDNEKNEEYEISTKSNNITYAEVGYFGQDSAGTTILLTDEEGKIEYLNLYAALKDNSFQTKTIEGIKNIIRFHLAEKGSKTASGGAQTILAEDNEGKFYDISKYISNY